MTDKRLCRTIPVLPVRDIEEATACGLETENWGARGFNLTDPSGNAVHVEQDG